MSRYKAYFEYKDSGIEWLGMVPKSWSVKKLKHVILSLESGVSVNAADVPAEDKEVGVLKTSCVYTRSFRPEENKTVLIEEISRVKCPVRKGEIIISRMNTPELVGASALVDSDSPNLFLPDRLWQTNFADINAQNAKFISYFMMDEGFRSQISLAAEGASSSMQNIAKNDYLSISIAFPKLLEQRIIANFLDHETAKIDTLIAKQQELIKLLKEKRQAVISHAVTKGLNPNAPMRDSGVEWLGEVPEHWEVTKFGYISMVVRGGSPRPAGNPLLFDGDYSPWVTVAEITKDDEIYLTSTESFLTKLGSKQCRVFSAGTLLLSNSGATLGVPKILTIDANANDGVVGFEQLRLNSEYAYFYLSTITEDLRERIKQGSGQPNLNTDIVKSIAITIPLDHEITEIVNFVNRTRAQFKSLTEQATKGIELLQERRTALISAAVTGKIDVRDWQTHCDTALAA
ncbi:restriction endonuclease subunit S [Undibacterium sp. Di26W]|uniref:restriction endonuclease subunit S n=1 Tax=Undibacterium sp. Di26W TaxID=3413035 RepID=UPI003BEFDD78